MFLRIQSILWVLAFALLSSLLSCTKEKEIIRTVQVPQSQISGEVAGPPEGSGAEDRQPPSVVSVGIPRDQEGNFDFTTQKTIRVTFSERVDLDGPSDNPSHYVSISGEGVSIDVAPEVNQHPDNENDIIILLDNSNFEFGKGYTVAISRFRDRSGNEMTAPYTFNFNTSNQPPVQGGGQRGMMGGMWQGGMQGMTPDMARDMMRYGMTQGVRLGEGRYTIRPVGGLRRDAITASLNCPAGLVIGDIKFRHGLLVNAIDGIFCKPPDNGDGGTWKDATLGGERGGNKEKFEAKAGSAPGGFAVQTVPFEGKSVLKALVVKEGPVNPEGRVEIPMASPSNSDKRFGQENANYPWFPVMCPQHYRMTGLTVRHGEFVEALGIKCKRVLAEGEAEPKIPQGQLGLGKGYELGPVNSSGKGITGENIFRAECPADTVMTGWSWAVDYNNRIERLGNIECEEVKWLRTVNENQRPRQSVAVNAGVVSDRAADSIEAPWGNCQTGFEVEVGDYHVGGIRYIETLFAATPYYAQFDNSNGGVAGSSVPGPTVGRRIPEPDRYILNCPDDYVLTGVKGTAGHYGVYTLGGICRQIVVGQ